MEFIPVSNYSAMRLMCTGEELFRPGASRGAEPSAYQGANIPGYLKPVNRRQCPHTDTCCHRNYVWTSFWSTTLLWAPASSPTTAAHQQPMRLASLFGSVPCPRVLMPALFISTNFKVSATSLSRATLRTGSSTADLHQEPRPSQASVGDWMDRDEKGLALTRMSGR